MERLGSQVTGWTFVPKRIGRSKNLPHISGGAKAWLQELQNKIKGRGIAHANYPPHRTHTL